MKLDWRLADEIVTDDCSEEERDLSYRKSVRCKVFLGFTSNLISSGVRDVVRYLVEHHMVSRPGSIFHYKFDFLGCELLKGFISVSHHIFVFFSSVSTLSIEVFSSDCRLM